MIDIIQQSIQRQNEKNKTSNIGNPFDVIPIKNMKQAKETVEVHLGGRGIEILEQFEAFKNLEVLWLNNNKLSEIKGLDANFRIKELYVHDNRLKTLKGSISKMGHLQTLSVYNNELSDLD
jgi:Leucine-rich repeat (LRR) protein